MKKMVLLLILILGLGLAACSTSPDDGDVPADGGETSMESLILEAFQNKYPNVDYSGVTVIVDKKSGNHAFGGLESTNGPGSWWYATMEHGIWIIVQDGNGDPSCDVLEEFEFPADLMPTGC